MSGSRLAGREVRPASWQRADFLPEVHLQWQTAGQSVQSGKAAARAGGAQPATTRRKRASIRRPRCSSGSLRVIYPTAAAAPAAAALGLPLLLLSLPPPSPPSLSLSLSLSLAATAAGVLGSVEATTTTAAAAHRQQRRRAVSCSAEDDAAAADDSGAGDEPAARGRGCRGSARLSLLCTLSLSLSFSLSEQ